MIHASMIRPIRMSIVVSTNPTGRIWFTSVKGKGNLRNGLSYIRESERQLRDYNQYTNRQLRNVSKESKSLTRYLWEEYHFDVAGDCFEVSFDGENYFTVSRDGVPHTPHTLTRKDKQIAKKRFRRRMRHFAVTNADVVRAKSVVRKTGALATVVAAA
jgi:hypothetical protein